MTGFSFKRFMAVLRKEWIQVRRDSFTLRMIIALPVMQLFLFGYAINADPKAIGNAAAALASLTTALDRDLPQAVQSRPANLPFQFAVHARYNPEQLTVLNIVPGLICIVLTISTLFVTTLSITRETERGTMENLLAM